MKKILFLIHDLGEGGAEKVLVNLVNNLDKTKFDISVISLFGGGVNEKFLNKHIKYKTVFKKVIPGNSHIMKLFSPQLLHRMLIKDKYDVEVSYLEGPATRIVGGCDNPHIKLVTWVHCTFKNQQEVASSFRSKKETIKIYDKFDLVACVSKKVEENIINCYPNIKESVVLYNTNETGKILSLKDESVSDITFERNEHKLCAIGKLEKVKGFDRLIRIYEKLLKDGLKSHLYILGEGSERTEIERIIKEKNIEKHVTLLGYKQNPYKYISKCDLFICSSYSEGFSTAATEALIVGIPVCTVDVSGMKEMLGDNNEYGVVVENNEEALYQGIKDLLDSKEKLEYYTHKAKERGKDFNTYNTVKAVEDMLLNL